MLCLSFSYEKNKNMIFASMNKLRGSYFTFASSAWIFWYDEKTKFYFCIDFTILILRHIQAQFGIGLKSIKMIVARNKEASLFYFFILFPTVNTKHHFVLFFILKLDKTLATVSV